MWYVKKKIPVQAVQIPENDFVKEGTNWLRDKAPQWLVDNCALGIVRYSEEGMIVSTLEGDMLCPWGSYIVCGVKGELYPCRRDVFEETYEPVKNNE